MRAIVLYLAIAALFALAAYIIRGNSQIISNLLLLAAVASLAILGVAVFIN